MYGEGREKHCSSSRPRKLASNPPITPQVETRSSDSLLLARVAELERKSAALEGAQAAIRDQVGADGGEISEKAQEPEQAPPTLEERTALVAAEIDKFEARYAAQSGVSPWAKQKEAELRSRVTTTKLGQVKSVECRGDMCRFEMEHETPEQADQFVNENEFEPGLRGTSFVRLGLGDGSYTFFVQPSSPQPTEGEQ